MVRAWQEGPVLRTGPGESVDRGRAEEWGRGVGRVMVCTEALVTGTEGSRSVGPEG